MIYLAYLDKLNIDKDIPFGIEIEIENKNITDFDEMLKCNNRFLYIDSKGMRKYFLDKMPTFAKEYLAKIPFFYFKDDLDNPWYYHHEVTNHKDLNKGLEIDSYILHNTENDFSKIKYICEFLTEHGCVTGNYCSTHIHIGAHPFGNDMRNVWNFILFYMLHEAIFYKFSEMGALGYIRKSAAVYARRLFPEKIEFLNYDVFLKKFDSLKKNYAFSLDEFDVHNLAFGSSFELRMFNGSLNPQVIQNYISLVLNSISYTQSNSFDPEKCLHKLNKALKKQDEIVDDYNSYADLLVDKFASEVFINKEEKDNFYEQYDGLLLKRKK